MTRFSWYGKWNNSGYRNKSIVGSMIVACLIMLGISARSYAIETSFTWNFTTPSNYSYDNSKVEPNDNKLRLSLRDAVKNFSVADGQLQSNNVLDVAADNTYYFVSTDLGIDVIRQDTWQRTAYVTAGGGFPTITVENGYLYAGKNGGIYRWQVSAMTNNTALGTVRYSTSTSPALADQAIRSIDSKYISGKVYLVATTYKTAQIIKDEQGAVSIVKTNLLPAGNNYVIVDSKLTSDGALYAIYR